MRIIYIFICILLLSAYNHIYADNKGLHYINATALTLIGKGAITDKFYHRIDTGKYSSLREPVKFYFTHSSGLAIGFKTNANTIAARWKVKERHQYPNLTPIAQKGLDLYIKLDNKWVNAGVGSPKKDSFSECVIVTNMNDENKECLLYLPIYAEILSLEIGIPEDRYIKPIENPFRHNILVYGSSILQGASVSRPGLNYSSVLSRMTGWNFINFGLSGNGKMEPEVANMIAELNNIDAFILDCIPNCSPKEIEERAENLIRTIRKRHPNVPIILIQTLIREKGNFDNKVKERVKLQNETIEIIYNKIKSDIADLYFIKENNFLGTDHEGSVDGTHPTDLGMYRMLNKTTPIIIDILKKYIDD